jgi:AraC family transcriptional regulator, regulatory protein of adaptative response / methylated-DNA-[protein]-cysteine methyltransferase
MVLKVAETDNRRWAARAHKPELRVGVHESPWGRVLVGLVGPDLATLHFVGRGRAVGVAVDEFVAAWPGANARCDNPGTAAALKRAVAAWGGNKAARLRLLLKGTDFQRQVWRALLEIPRGETTTYGAIARQVKKPGASRAVGAAVGANPVGVLVPCHRVLAGGGKLGGYAWGVDKKKALLQSESAQD